MSRDQSADETAEAADSREDSGVSRRKLLATGAATWATVGLAGCSYITDPGPGDEGDDSDGEQTPDGTDTNGTADEQNGTTTVTNETTTTGSGGGGCASLGRFAGGMDIAMNVDVFDQDSGQHLGADSVEDVRVEFPNAEFDPIELDWSGPHEEFTEEQWGGKLQTDQDVESGTYQYEIVVEGNDVDGEERVTDQLTIV